MTQQRALVLTGSLGMGHHVVTEVLAESLGANGWSTQVLDCMTLLGKFGAKAGDVVFRQLISRPTLYDGLHFSHLRPGSNLAAAMDRGATSRLVPALRTHLASQPADLLVAAFATGASAIAKLTVDQPRHQRPATVALCTDVTPHRLWVWEGLDLFLVTSSAAAASVRRYAPRAPIAVVPPPVRPTFYDTISQDAAREHLGIPPDSRCVLLMGGGWGLGPLVEVATTLAEHEVAGRDVVVTAVAGHNQRLAGALETASRKQPRLVPFGFTDQIPLLMAAADLVVTTPGATTCSEARVVGRPLMLLDVVPGHGRDNVQHELELGDADVCDPDPHRLAEAVLAALERCARPQRSSPAVNDWDARFAEALAVVGIVPSDATRSGGTPAGTPTPGPFHSAHDVC